MNSLRIAGRFPLGRIVYSERVFESLTDEQIGRALVRHSAGRWGDVDPREHDDNERALAHGHRLRSTHLAPNGEPFWVITDVARVHTTVLFPEEF